MKTVRILLAAAALAAPAAATSHAQAKPAPVEVQLLALNDFHGHLESTTPGAIQLTADPASRVPAGGAEYLATHLRRLEAANKHTTIVSAGDLIGASPLLSALFRDEPTIEAMNLIGLDLNAVGNHEFDEGAEELRRMQQGGCHPTDGCFGGDGFAGADFRFLAANVVDAATRRPIFPAYAIRKYNGIKVGFIGMTLEGTPDIVAQAGIQGLEFLDEAETANHYARVLREDHGVRAIVVLLHEGATQAAPFGVNTCNGIGGPVIDIVDRTTQAVDLFITGHTHSPYNCVVDGRPVTSASSFGRLVTDIDVQLDRRTKDVTRVSANNIVITQDVPRASALTELIARYQELAAPLAGRVIGRAETPLTRDADDTGETPMGNLIADAQLAATRDAGAVAAFMNPGGVRAGLDAGDVTYGEAFTVQPFGNSLVTMTLTGAQLLEMLKQQWCGQTGGRRILHPSESVTYTYDAALAAEITGDDCAGAPNPVADLRIAGAPVDPAADYRVTVNSFLADGGDRFFVLRQGTGRTGGALDLDALEAYLAQSLAGAPVAAPALDRIDRA